MRRRPRADFPKSDLTTEAEAEDPSRSARVSGPNFSDRVSREVDTAPWPPKPHCLALRRGLRKRAVVALFENAPRGLLPLLDRLCGFHACRPGIPADAGPAFHVMPVRV